LKNTWDKAHELILKTQETQKQQVDKYRREVDFGPGDWVYVTTKYWDTGRPSKKLDQQMAGSFHVIERVGNIYKLELPESIRVHPVFSSDKLHKTPQDPLLGQIPDKAPAIEVDGKEE
jgi:hypothetical protein